jgi:hypothetical protein
MYTYVHIYTVTCVCIYISVYIYMIIFVYTLCICIHRYCAYRCHRVTHHPSLKTSVRFARFHFLRQLLQLLFRLAVESWGWWMRIPSKLTNISNIDMKEQKFQSPRKNDHMIKDGGCSMSIVISWRVNNKVP